LIGFGVKYSVDQPEEIRKELRQKTLDGPDQENLIHVAIDIADNCTAIGKASKLQPSKTEVRSNDNSRLLILAGQHLSKVREQATKEPLGAGHLAPESQRKKS
jgi:hypothetical protein